MSSLSNTIWTYSRYFPGCPWLRLTSARGANIKKVCIRKACDRGACIRDISAYAGDVCIRDTCSSDA